MGHRALQASATATITQNNHYVSNTELRQSIYILLVSYTALHGVSGTCLHFTGDVQTLRGEITCSGTQMYQMPKIIPTPPAPLFPTLW